MAENTESSNSSPEGIIEQIKDFVSSSIKKITGTVKSAISKILDMVETSLTGKTKSPSEQPSPTPSRITPEATTKNSAEIPAPTTNNAEPTETPAPTTQENNNATQPTAQPENTENNETQKIKQKIQLIDEQLDSATKEEQKPIFEGMDSSPSKDAVEHTVMNILQNTVHNSQKTMKIQPFGIAQNGLTAEEVANTILETLAKGKEYTEKLDHILIHITDPDVKAAFEKVFPATTTQHAA